MSVGWVAGSIPTQDGKWTADRLASGVRNWAPGPVEAGSSWDRHYGARISAADGSWAVHYDGRGGASGSALLVIRQAVFEGLAGASGMGLARWALGEVRATRVDVAGDDYAKRVRPRDLFDARETAETRTHRRGWELTERGDGVQVVRIGSRASARFGRVYDKSDERGDRVRHEIELKGVAAVAAAEWIGSYGGLADLWRAEWAHLVRFPGLAGWVALVDQVDASAPV